MTKKVYMPRAFRGLIALKHWFKRSEPNAFGYFACVLKNGAS